ncbi:kinase/pyrophosphorylase [Dellaglioa sp. BT-FLS60]
MQKIILYIISDSIGNTGLTLANAFTAQFPDIDFEFQRHPFTRTLSLLSGLLKSAQRDDAVIVHTFVDPDLSDYVTQFSLEHNLSAIDGISNSIAVIQKKSGFDPIRIPGGNHNLNQSYFDKIEAIEFAVRYDQTADVTGLSKADIIILGAPKTSKTALSLFLAMQNYKVANFPLTVDTQIPKELFKIESQKIIGLKNTSATLNTETELITNLYKKIKCLVIDVADRSIEETATLITESLSN